MEQATIDKEWEVLVVSGPLSINYLASLLVISSQKDFSFVRPTPDFIYRYIRYPNSFRATLTQLSGEMYQSFLDAHTSMNQIQLLMQQIPRNIYTTLKVLTQGSPRLIQSILPSSLNNIERIINDCLNSANGTANKLGSVMHLLQEIIEMNENTQSWNENAIAEIAIAINESLLEQEEIVRQKNQIEEQCAESKEALKEAHQAYLDAAKGIPTRAPLAKVTMAPTQSPIGIPSKPSRSFFCSFGLFCSKYKRRLAAYNEAVQRERERQENNRKIKEAFDSEKEAERQRIEREEKIISEARQDAANLLELLKQAENAYDQYYKELLQKENTMVSNIMKLSKLKLDEIKPQQTIEILLNATKELTKIKVQWDGLTKFFLDLAARVSITHGVIVHEFVDYIQNTIIVNAAPLDNATLQYFTEILIEPVAMVDRHSHLLYIMSRTYYDISSEYMMGQIAGITGLSYEFCNIFRHMHYF